MLENDFTTVLIGRAGQEGVATRARSEEESVARKEQEEEEEEEEEEEQEAFFSHHAWVVSCRSSRSRDFFSKRMLMYQPDLRCFCPHGQACKLKDDETHQALYIHGLKPTDRSETILLNQEDKGRKSGTKKRTKKARLPYVSHAYVIGKNVSTKLEGVPTNRVVLLFVHGFNENYLRIISYLNHLAKDPIFADTNSTSNRESVCRMAFVWPSQTTSYFRARFFSEIAAKKLLKVLHFLTFHGNKIVLVGHSMGCRVVLHTLLTRAKKKPSSLDCLVEHLFLLGGGVASDSLDERFGQFPASRILAKKISVLFSRRDKMLANAFPFAELLPGVLNYRPIAAGRSLGVDGLAKGKLNEYDKKVDEIDCSSQVSGHSTHLYLNSSIALSPIRASLESLLNDSLPLVSRI